MGILEVLRGEEVSKIKLKTAMVDTDYFEGIISVEKGKSEVGKDCLPPFELDLFHKGYKIVSDFSMCPSEFTTYVDVYKGDELHCAIIHHCECYQFEVTYYKNDAMVKTDWYLNGEKLNKSTDYYNGNGDKYIYYGSIKFLSDERVLYKEHFGKRVVISESDLSKYIPTDVISM